MKMDFCTAAKFFENNRIRELSLSKRGLRFLKLRSLSRKAHMEYLVSKYSINVGNSNSKEWLRLIFESDVTSRAIDESISHLYELERSPRRKNEEQLIEQLYKVKSFEWGGLHQNSLETTIVNNYVKRIVSYDSLSEAIENELHHSMRSYVLASWYNHWTSIIIEDLFKDHEKVIPTIGLVKKIDFFVNDKPFDLKVTYLPEGYVKNQRKSDGMKPEITLMKQLCRDLKIGYDPSLPESALISDLWRKLDDHPNSIAKELVSELQEHREDLLNRSVANSHTLMRWLYENQGIRRFDASNRLFLILVDKRDFFNSWKLKRAKPLMQHEINGYLSSTENVGIELDFDWKGTSYKVESDVIFVIK